MTHIFEVKQLNTGYQDVRILSDLSVAIEKGKVTTIIGPNGCGKSTLLKTLGRILKSKAVKFFCRSKTCKRCRQRKLQRS